MCYIKRSQVHPISQIQSLSQTVNIIQYKPAIYGIKYENGEWYAIDKYENKLDSNIPYVSNMINHIRTIEEELMSMEQIGEN